MSHVGRNDPCPCGSGKKYKNCCMKADRARRIRESAWHREEQVTLDKLVAFAQRPAFQPQLTVAFNLFWNGNYGAEGWNALGKDEIGRFLDWYVHDYRLEQSKKRLVDVFLEEAGATLLPTEQQRVRAWSDSYMSVYRITGLGQQGTLSLADVLTGKEENTAGDALGQLAVMGDLILGRILRSSQPPHFSWAAVLLPAALEADLASYMASAYEQHKERYPEASWPDFLSQSSYMLNHQLLKHATEGRKTVRAGVAYYDASRTVEALRDAERRLRERAAKEAHERRQEQEKRPQDKEPPIKQTQGGILLPGSVEYRDRAQRKQLQVSTRAKQKGG